MVILCGPWIDQIQTQIDKISNIVGDLTEPMMGGGCCNVRWKSNIG